MTEVLEALPRVRNSSARQRTILLLIADTGAGHRSAANAIARALRLVTAQDDEDGYTLPGVAIHIVDAFAECARFPLRKTISLYGPVTKRSPQLYRRIFYATNSTERFNTARRLCQPFLRQGLRALIERTQPDIIVSVHPLLNHVTLQVLQALGLHIPFMTVVTDLVSAHSAWFAPEADACIVPTEATRWLALANGARADRIHVLGMPVDLSFSLGSSATIVERRSALGFDADRPVVLLVGGGEGVCGLAESAKRLACQHPGVQLLIVTGHNRQLYAHLQQLKRTFRAPAQILGFVQNMPELMRVSDIIVTKAGPGTISEAVACELPIVLTGALPGQEEGNIDFVLQHGLGVLAPTPVRLVEQVAALTDPAQPLLQQMRMRARAISRPYAVLDIARFIAGYDQLADNYS